MSRHRRQPPQWSLSAGPGTEVEGGENGAEEQPRAVAARHQVGVLALPAEPGGGGERLFHQRRGVAEHLDLAAKPRRHPPGELLEAALENVVIVAVAGIDGNGAVLTLGQARQRVVAGSIGKAHHHRAAGLCPQGARRAPAVKGVGKPAHVAVQPLGNEGGQRLAGGGDRVGPCEADRVEPKRQRALANAVAGGLRNRGRHNGAAARRRARSRREGHGRPGAILSWRTSRAPAHGLSRPRRRDSRPRKARRRRPDRHG